MTDVETLTERVRTVERAVMDGDHTFPAADDLADLTERLDALEEEVAEIEERTAEVEAATQALRGYVGNVRSVNERVQQRADTALAATERLERRLDGEGTVDTPGHEAGHSRTTDDRRATVGGADEHPETATRATGTGRVGRGGQDDPDGTNADGGEAAGTDGGLLERMRSLL